MGARRASGTLSAVQPLVSCLITSYNYAHLIERAIESALAQDYGAEHLEIVIVDDGSTDETAAVVAPYLGKRVRFVVKENGGLTSSANRAMAEARGEFLAFLDADDEWAPDNVSRKMEVMLARPEVGLVYSDLETIDAEGALLEPSYFGMLGLTAPRSPEFLGAQLVRNYPVSGSILLRASLVPRFAPVDETLIVHDWPISNAIAQLAAVELVDAPLVRYRQHGANMNLGIGGEVRRHISGGENEIRRRALAAVRPGQAADGHLVEAIVQLDHVYAEVGDPAAWVTVTDAQRVLAA
ncbi:MAG: hypothetical protein QOK49_4688, partial [Baekduia sp.]|nr:hypothetical protein [Baekduia sp.]